jgi:hypothetical protein
MDTHKGPTNIISDIRLSVAFLSLCGFFVFFIIASFLVVKLMELSPNSNSVNLTNVKLAFSYFQGVCLVVGSLFAIMGIKKILRLRQYNMPRIQLSKPFSRIFTIIGIFIGLMLILFLLPSSTAYPNLKSMEILKAVRFYAKIFVFYTFGWYLVTLWLRKNSSIYSISATTSFSLISPICLFPFGFIFLLVWLFFRGSEMSKLIEIMPID